MCILYCTYYYNIRNFFSKFILCLIKKVCDWKALISWVRDQKWPGFSCRILKWLEMCRITTHGNTVTSHQQKLFSTFCFIFTSHFFSLTVLISVSKEVAAAAFTLHRPTLWSEKVQIDWVTHHLTLKSMDLKIF